MVKAIPFGPFFFPVGAESERPRIMAARLDRVFECLDWILHLNYFDTRARFYRDFWDAILEEGAHGLQEGPYCAYVTAEELHRDWDSYFPGFPLKPAPEHITEGLFSCGCGFIRGPSLLIGASHLQALVRVLMELDEDPDTLEQHAVEFDVLPGFDRRELYKLLPHSLLVHQPEQPFARLRELLSQAPGPTAWDELWELIWHCNDAEHLFVALDYAQEHLEDWSDELRRFTFDVLRHPDYLPPLEQNSLALFLRQRALYTPDGTTPEEFQKQLAQAKYALIRTLKIVGADEGFSSAAPMLRDFSLVPMVAHIVLDFVFEEELLDILEAIEGATNLETLTLHGCSLQVYVVGMFGEEREEVPPLWRERFFRVFHTLSALSRLQRIHLVHCDELIESLQQQYPEIVHCEAISR